MADRIARIGTAEPADAVEAAPTASQPANVADAPQAPTNASAPHELRTPAPVAPEELAASFLAAHPQAAPAPPLTPLHAPAAAPLPESSHPARQAPSPETWYVYNGNLRLSQVKGARRFLRELEDVDERATLSELVRLGVDMMLQAAQARPEEVRRLLTAQRAQEHEVRPAKTGH